MDSVLRLDILRDVEGAVPYGIKEKLHYALCPISAIALCLASLSASMMLS